VGSGCELIFLELDAVQDVLDFLVKHIEAIGEPPMNPKKRPFKENVLSDVAEDPTIQIVEVDLSGKLAKVTRSASRKKVALRSTHDTDKSVTTVS